MEYLHLCNKINKYRCIKYVLSHSINYQSVSIASDTIISVALHEYYEDNKLPNCVSGTTQRWDRWRV